MTKKAFEYQIITAVGREKAGRDNGGELVDSDNAVFKKVERFVNEALREGWSPVGGVAVADVILEHVEIRVVRVSQALVREIDK